MSRASASRSAGTLRAALLSVLAATALIAIKLVAGLTSGSLALVAEAAHSGTDLVAALLTFAVLRIALRPADEDHPYGHGKAEHLAALGEGAFLLIVSTAIAVRAAGRLFAGAEHEVDASLWVFVVLALVIAIDATRLIALRRAAHRYDSAALAATALHFASDALGTIAVVVGFTVVAVTGWQQADAIAALVVAVLVVAAAVRLMLENANVLMDRAPAGVEDVVRAAVAEAETGVTLGRVRVRSAAGRHFIEVVVGYRADAGLGEGHAAADVVERAIETALPGSDVFVHVEPAVDREDLRARASAAALTVRGVREIHDVRVIELDRRLELSLHLKLPADLDLAAAHELATTVEQEIERELPELADVHTHLEPLAEQIGTVRPDSGEASAVARTITRLVEEATSEAPRRLSFREADDGLVALLTIALPASRTIDSAHATATELETRITAALPAVRAVVIHTEPL